MSEELTIVAILTIKEGQRDFVRSEILKILEPTRAEEGCLLYVLHEDITNSQVLMFYETWADHACWQAHLQQAHMQAYVAATKDFVEHRQILQLTKNPA